MEAEVFAYEVLGNSVKIWRCFSYDKQVDVPEFLEGLPVTELAPYVFSRHMDVGELERLKAAGKLKYGTRDNPQGLEVNHPGEAEDSLPPELCGMDLEAVSLPQTLRKIGRYAFYNCNRLYSFKFHSALSDLGAGLFTGCHHVSEIFVTLTDGEPSCLKMILTEITEELRVEYWQNGQFCKLVFPEYYEEGGEDTPAKNTKVIYHGSGLHFRNCFKDGHFQFGWYDERFFRAQSMERGELALELAILRLLYPAQLRDVHRENYEQYIKEHLLEAGRWLMDHESLKQVEWLLESPVYRERVTAELLEQLTEYARKTQMAEAVSYMMDLKHRRFRPKVKSFDL